MAFQTVKVTILPTNEVKGDFSKERIYPCLLKYSWMFDKEEKGKLIYSDSNIKTPTQLQHLYIISDDEIKLFDCVYNNKENIVEQINSKTQLIFVLEENKENQTFKKIVITTDQDLIKDGVQAIDDEFLEWFSSKNPTCEFVEIYQDKKDYGEFQWYSEYKIIFPKEKQKQILSEMMQEDEKSGLYDETLKLKRNYEKHSLTKTKGYKLWCNIIQRCYNPKNPSYKYYGEKGVIMEDYFKNSYENFINWIKGIAHYNEWLNSSELSLDRIDNTLGYSRGNIKFSTKTEQVENQNLRVDNKSGYKGVCYHKLNKKYSATITINKSKVFLGYYDTALEAALVYDNYVLKNNLNRKTNL